MYLAITYLLKVIPDFHYLRYGHCGYGLNKWEFELTCLFIPFYDIKYL